jgi:hypothetical protein
MGLVCHRVGIDNLIRGITTRARFGPLRMVPIRTIRSLAVVFKFLVTARRANDPRDGPLTVY